MDLRPKYAYCAKVIKALQENPDVGTKLKKALDLDLDNLKPKANHIRCLSLILRKDFSVQDYEEFKNDVNKTVGYAAYPSYKTVAKSKVFLHPPVSTIFAIMVLMLINNCVHF